MPVRLGTVCAILLDGTSDLRAGSLAPDPLASRAPYLAGDRTNRPDAQIAFCGLAPYVTGLAQHVADAASYRLYVVPNTKLHDGGRDGFEERVVGGRSNARKGPE